ncbi:hypothetical protein CVU83_00100 [Candidatus Falkowbacteria bacterium HGW-Falkowbacteria-2]|uniref:Uncharacterized protein n=1 Tax=Candidatus Falkowbacteria bacterium HGW-Falkowbacteria-2 TaxID=2013769 RepID=A0A2N2E3X0_9BACT|nr:MAG: hypothetical protein CVU83_00100 [Candidatus Falkowbacteria bacterium HGW-Falkowbacteria-2]
MKTKNRFTEIQDIFTKYENRMSDLPDENECQIILLELVKAATSIKPKETGLASKFESDWFNFRDKIKDFSDCRIYLDAKKEIEKHLSAILEPDSVNS